jgi:type IV pilus assembly protein PilF
MRLMGLIALLLLLGACSQQKNSDIDYERASEINTNLGIAYMQSGDLNQAKEKMEKALKQDPESATGNMAYGLLMQRINEPELADKHFKKALDLKPTDPNLQNNYGGFPVFHRQVRRRCRTVPQGDGKPALYDATVCSR